MTLRRETSKHPGVCLHSYYTTAVSAACVGLMLTSCGGTSKEPRPNEPDAATPATTASEVDASASSPDASTSADAGNNDGGPTSGLVTGNLDVTLETADAAQDAAGVDAGTLDASANTDMDANTSNTDELDAARVDAADGTTGECVPSTPAAETCDGLDNDCNGLVDDVDELGDGIFDCLQIALFGNAGLNGSANFVNWLGQQGPMGVTRMQTDSTPLTEEAIEDFSIIILDMLTRPYTEQEAQVLAAWVQRGGGLIAMTGYVGSAADVDNPNSLLAPYGAAYALGLQSGPITAFSDHPTVADLTSVTFSGGYGVLLEGSDASPGAFEGVATLPSGDVGAAAADWGKGRIFMWGDEWIEFDSEWSSQPDVPKLWANVTSWVAHLSN